MVWVPVGDVNEVFSIFAPRLSVSEQANVGTVIGQVSMSDPDLGSTLNGQHNVSRFSLNTSTPLFSVSSDGQVRVASDLDFDTLTNPATETKYPVNVTIVVMDSPGTGFGFELESWFLVDTVNVDEPPVPFVVVAGQGGLDAVFTEGPPETLFLLDDIRSATSIVFEDPDGTPIAVSVDVGPPGSTPPCAAGQFVADNSTVGNPGIRPSGFLDFETFSRCTLQLQVLDKAGGAGFLSTSYTVTVIVQDTNDPAVVSDMAFKIPENSGPGTCLEADPPASADYINVTVGSSMQNVTVFVNQTVACMVNVSGVNGTSSLQPGNCTEAVATEVEREVPLFQRCYVVPFTDADVTDRYSGVQPYSTVPSLSTDVSSDTGLHLFSVNSSHGFLVVAGGSPVDHEDFLPTGGVVNVTIAVTDQAGVFGTGTMRVTIVDVPEAPQFVAAPYSFSVPEISPPGFSLGGMSTLNGSSFPLPAVAAVDEDGGGSPVTYSLVSADPAYCLGWVVLDPINGSMVLSSVGSGSLDFEQLSFFSLLIAASDGVLSTTTNVSVLVSNVNERPQLVSVVTELVVSEDAPMGAVLLSQAGVARPANASDPDGATVFEYGIGASSLPGLFVVDATSGEVSVSQPSLLNFEILAEYWIEFIVSDGDLSVAANVSIQVLDANDSPAALDGVFAFPEHESVGQGIGGVQLSDEDSTDSLSVVFLDGNDVLELGPLLSVEVSQASRIAAFTVARGANYGGQPRTYSITAAVCDFNCSVVEVLANSTARGASSSFSLTVSILPIEEFPVFVPTTEYLEENAEQGFAFANVLATDEDIAEQGDTLAYFIRGVQSPSSLGFDFFAVDQTSGSLRVADGVSSVPGSAGSIDFETDSWFELLMEVRDSTNRSVFGNVSVLVVDVPEPPMMSTTQLFLAENSPTWSAAGLNSTEVAVAGASIEPCSVAGPSSQPVVVSHSAVDGFLSDSALLNLWNSAPVVGLPALGGSQAVHSNLSVLPRIEVSMSLLVRNDSDVVLVEDVSRSGQAIRFINPAHAAALVQDGSDAGCFSGTGAGCTNSTFVPREGALAGEVEPQVGFSLFVDEAAREPFSEDGLPRSLGVGIALTNGSVNAEVWSQYMFVLTTSLFFEKANASTSVNSSSLISLNIVNLNEAANISIENFNEPFLPTVRGKAAPGTLLTDLEFHVADPDVQVLVPRLSVQDPRDELFFTVLPPTLQRDGSGDWPTLQLQVNSTVTADGLLPMTIYLEDPSSVCLSSAPLDFTVSVQDVNDAPDWVVGTGESMNVSVPETTYPLDVATVVALDEDLCQNLEYSVLGDLASHFLVQHQHINLTKCGTAEPLPPGISSQYFDAVCEACVLDAGSERTLISKSAVIQLARNSIDFETLQAEQFGGKYTVTISVTDEPYLFSTVQSRYLLSSVENSLSRTSTLQVFVSDMPEQPLVTKVSTALGEGLSTAGSESIVLDGVDFPSAHAPFPGLPVPIRVTYQSNVTAGSPEFEATGCFVSVGFVQIICSSAPGFGTDFFFKVQFGVSSDPRYRGMVVTTSPFSNTSISYARPTVDSLTGPGTEDADTAGGQLVTIRGAQFGTRAANRVDLVSYGPSASEFVAANCSVTVDHSEIQCLTAEGLGTGIRWSVMIAGQSWQQPATTGYARPNISHAVVGTADGLLPTAGGGVVNLHGVNMGPLSPPPSFDTTVSSLRLGLTTHTSNSSIASLAEPTLLSSSCDVLSGHSLVRCVVPPGVGKDLAMQITVGGQVSPVSQATVTFRAPGVRGASCGSAATLARAYLEPGVAAGVEAGTLNSSAQTAFLAADSVCALSTEGGAEVALQGTDFGRIQDVPQVLFGSSLSVASNASGGAGQGASGLHAIASATVTLPHEEVSFVAPPGNGALHAAAVQVGSQEGPAAFAVGYMPPNISTISIAQPRNANGIIVLQVQGANFGACCWRRVHGQDSPNDAACRCVPDEDNRVAFAPILTRTFSSSTPLHGHCNVTSVMSDSQLLCETTVLKGAMFLWVGGQVSPTSLAYEYIALLNAPTILDVVPESASTAGGDIIHLIGDTFGDTQGSVEFLFSAPASEEGDAPAVIVEVAVVGWTNTNVTIIVPPGQGEPAIRLRQFQADADKYFDSLDFQYSAPSVQELRHAIGPTSGYVGALHLQRSSSVVPAPTYPVTLLEVWGENFGQPWLLPALDADLNVGTTLSGLDAALSLGGQLFGAFHPETQLPQSNTSMKLENSILVGGRPCLVVSWSSHRIACGVQSGIGTDLDIVLKLHNRRVPLTNTRFETKARIFTIPAVISEGDAPQPGTYSYAAPSNLALHCIAEGASRDAFESAAVNGTISFLSPLLTQCNSHSRTRGERTWPRFVVVTGSSFGSAQGIVRVKGIPVAVQVWAQNFVVFQPSEGFGVNVPVSVQQAGLGQTSEEFPLFNYAPPVVQGIAEVGASSASLTLRRLQVASDNGTLEVQSHPTFDARRSRLRITGYNFGVSEGGTALEEALEARVFVGGFPCIAPEGGSTYISDSVLECIVTDTHVGAQNLTLSVAGHELFIPSSELGISAQCRSGYYGFEDGLDKCLPCPSCPKCDPSIASASVCAGANALPMASAGMWRVASGVNTSLSGSAGAFSFLPCTPAEACLDGNVCATGYQRANGELNDPCTECAVKFTRNAASGLCEPCPANAEAQAAVVLLIVGAAALIGYRLVEYAPTFTGLTMFVDTAQLLAVSGKISLQWIPDMSVLFSTGSVFQLNLPSLAAPECTLPVTYDDTYYAIIALPLIVLLLLSAVYALASLRSACKGRGCQAKDAFPTLMGFYVTLCFFLYVTLVSTSMEALQCTRVGDSLRLKAELSFSCETSRYAYLRTWAYTALAVYGVGIPLGLFCLLKYNQDGIKRCILLGEAAPAVLVDPQRNADYGVHVMLSRIYRPFTARHHKWQVVSLARKFLVVFATSFLFSEAPAAAAIWAMIITTAFLNFHQSSLPYRRYIPVWRYKAAAKLGMLGDDVLYALTNGANKQKLAGRRLRKIRPRALAAADGDLGIQLMPAPDVECLPEDPCGDVGSAVPAKPDPLGKEAPEQPGSDAKEAPGQLARLSEAKQRPAPPSPPKLPPAAPSRPSSTLDQGGREGDTQPAGPAKELASAERVAVPAPSQTSATLANPLRQLPKPSTSPDAGGGGCAAHKVSEDWGSDSDGGSMSSAGGVVDLSGTPMRGRATTTTRHSVVPPSLQDMLTPRSNRISLVLPNVVDAADVDSDSSHVSGTSEHTSSEGPPTPTTPPAAEPSQALLPASLGEPSVAAQPVKWTGNALAGSAAAGRPQGRPGRSSAGATLRRSRPTSHRTSGWGLISSVGALAAVPAHDSPGVRKPPGKDRHGQFSLGNPLLRAKGEAARAGPSVQRAVHVKRGTASLSPLGAGATVNPMLQARRAAGLVKATASTRRSRASQRPAVAPSVGRNPRLLRGRRTLGTATLAAPSADIPDLVAPTNFSPRATRRRGADLRRETELMAALVGEDPSPPGASTASSLSSFASSDSGSESSEGGGFTSSRRALLQGDEDEAALFGGLSLDEFLQQDAARDRTPSTAQRTALMMSLVTDAPSSRRLAAPVQLRSSGNSLRRQSSRAPARRTLLLSRKQQGVLSAGLSGKLRGQAGRELDVDAVAAQGAPGPAGDLPSAADLSSPRASQNPLHGIARRGSRRRQGAATARSTHSVLTAANMPHMHKREQPAQKAPPAQVVPASAMKGDTVVVAANPMRARLEAMKRASSRTLPVATGSVAKTAPSSTAKKRPGPPPRPPAPPHGSPAVRSTSLLAATGIVEGGESISAARPAEGSLASQADSSLSLSDDERQVPLAERSAGDIRKKRASRKADREAWKEKYLGWLRVFFYYNELEVVFAWSLNLVIATGLLGYVLTQAEGAEEAQTEQGSIIAGATSGRVQAYVGLVVAVLFLLLGVAVSGMEIAMALLFFAWRMHAVRKFGITGSWLQAREDVSRMASMARNIMKRKSSRAPK